MVLSKKIFKWGRGVIIVPTSQEESWGINEVMYVNQNVWSAE